MSSLIQSLLDHVEGITSEIFTPPGSPIPTSSSSSTSSSTTASAETPDTSLPAVDPAADPFASLSTDNVPRLVHGWVDVHAHFSPPTTQEQTNKRWQAMRDSLFLTPSPPLWSVDSTLRYMDAAGIQLQLLSNIPKQLDQLQHSNTYGAQVVQQHPTRFGLLAALPTDNTQAALTEANRAADQLHADGYAVTTCYNGRYLGDEALDALWVELDRRGSVVFVHPDAYSPPSMGRPSPLIEVAFDTTRTIVDMMYSGWFRRYQNIKLIVAHCGACLPALSGRLQLLGCEPWIPNPQQLTPDEIRETLSGIYVDTAAMGSAHSVKPVLEMTSAEHICYGSDCGVPCTTSRTMTRNLELLLASDVMSQVEIQAVGRNVLKLVPSVAARLKRKGRRQQRHTMRSSDSKIESGDPTTIHRGNSSNVRPAGRLP